ncbi:hypothetical protein WQ59_27435 [Streptomyces sp. KE1]|nr:hypothetical protein WQ59_27435 [Streptomyces sp. KE1]
MYQGAPSSGSPRRQPLEVDPREQFDAGLCLGGVRILPGVRRLLPGEADLGPGPQGVGRRRIAVQEPGGRGEQVSEAERGGARRRGRGGVLGGSGLT